MSVTGPQGFLASGIASGIKPSGALDLALVCSASGPVPAVAMFTTNKAAAAPVQVSKEHLRVSGGRIGAVVLNSGCANAATGPSGLEAAHRTTRALASSLSLLDEQVLVCSTGLIGIPLPIDTLLAGIDPLVQGAGPSAEHGILAASAILTTDTHPKQVLIDGGGFSVGGMAKGAGMISPNLATMLVVLTTDAAVKPYELASAFRIAVQGSFNELTVDGCTSTNDTVIGLASGMAGPVGSDKLTSALEAACIELVEQLALDAEGTTKLCRIHVRGAKTHEDARRAGRRVAESLLVKTSLFGADPYWGRVVSELGSSGAAFDLDRVAISYGDVLVFAQGIEQAHDRDAVAGYLGQNIVEITCDLGLGEYSNTIRTTDLGHGYVEENMRTS